MRTPREILFQKHEAAGPRLDAIRRKVLQNEVGGKERPMAAPAGWLGFLWDFRGHLAAMSAIWVLVMVLRLSSAPPGGAAASMAVAASPSPQVILATLRANRLQLLELVGSPDSHPAEVPDFVPNRPSSARRDELFGV